MNLKNKIKNLKNAGDITIAQVKACKIFKGISDEGAKRVIETFRKFSEIIFDYYHNVVKPKKMNDEDIEPDKINLAL